MLKKMKWSFRELKISAFSLGCFGRRNLAFPKAPDRKGFSLIAVIILIFFAILIITPLLAFTYTGFRTGRVFETRSNDLYAADAGVQNAIWEIKSGNIQNFTFPAPYNEYDYSTVWPDPLMPASVNGQPVNVTLQNYWIPRGSGIPNPPSVVQATNIQNNQRLIVTGNTVDFVNDNGNLISKYEVRITYYPNADEPLSGNSNLKIRYIGVWLPQGFQYYSSTNYKSSPESINPAYTPIRSNFGGNEARIWNFSTPVSLSAFGINRQNFPWETSLTFYFRSLTPYEPYLKPEAISWIMTTGESDLSYTWDADVKICKVISTTPGTTNETYVTRSEVRKLASAISGDYYATGNALQVYPNSSSRYRSTPNTPSSAAVTSSNIPADAEVSAAFLYWSGWKNSNAINTLINGNTSNFNYTGTPWSTSGTTTFRGNTATGIGDLTLASSRNLSTTGSGGAVLTWNQYVTPGYSDGCSSLSSSIWTRSGTSPYSNTSWGADDLNSYFKAHNNNASVPENYKYLTLTNPVNLASYNGTAQVAVSWDQWVSGTCASSDQLSFDISVDNFATYTRVLALSGDSTGSLPVRYTYILPGSYVTGQFKIRFYVAGFSTTDLYCNIDNITVAPAYTADNGLYFSISTDNGVSWSANIQSYRGDTQGKVNFSYTVPDVYLKNNFLVRFHLTGYNTAGQYFYLDNIRLTTMAFNSNCAFYIDKGSGRQQVSFDINGLPQEGGSLTPTRTQVLRDYIGTSPDGFSYSCYRDVTDLIRWYLTDPMHPAANIPGYATYWVGGVDSDGKTSPYDEIAYSGWSLIIVYTSPATLGHQLYLFDRFVYSNHNSRSGVNVDFDNDGKPGGTISGFVVPPQVAGEVNAAKITCFVGEGDPFYTGDYIAISRADGSYLTKLWDGTNTTSNSSSNPNNIWNSTSPGSAYGIDIDTLGINPPAGQYITWDSNILRQGDSSVHIDLWTHEDVWNMVYIIFSFRSATTIGGQRNFQIR
jgi:hypothetical protein